MKVLIVLSAVLVTVFGNPAGNYYSLPVQVAQIPAYTFQAAPVQESYIKQTKPIVTGNLYASMDTEGKYNFGYTSSDGQAKSESKESDGDVAGKFSYVSPEGENIELKYSAGKGGFQAEGDHLPEAPELPEELAAAYAEAHAALEKAHEEARQRGDVEPVDTKYDDGSYRPEHEGNGNGNGGDNGGEKHQQQQHVTYQVPAAPTRVYYAGGKSSHSAIHQVVHRPAPQAVYVQQQPVIYQVPKQVEAPSAPAVYSSSSYQTEIGGKVAVAVAPPSAPVRQYAVQHVAAAPSTHKKSGYARY